MAPPAARAPAGRRTAPGWLWWWGRGWRGPGPWSSCGATPARGAPRGHGGGGGVSAPLSYSGHHWGRLPLLGSWPRHNWSETRNLLNKEYRLFNPNIFNYYPPTMIVTKNILNRSQAFSFSTLYPEIHAQVFCQGNWNYELSLLQLQCHNDHQNVNKPCQYFQGDCYVKHDRSDKRNIHSKVT